MALEYLIQFGDFDFDFRVKNGSHMRFDCLYFQKKTERRKVREKRVNQ